MRFTDRVFVRLVSADVGNVLRAINEKGVPVYDVSVSEDTLTCDFAVAADAVSIVENIAGRRGDGFSILHKNSASDMLQRLWKRPVLILGIFTIFLLTLWLPTRVFFIQVRGNDVLPTDAILSAAEGCGVYFGMPRKELRSEKMKNALLEVLPELQWAGINTAGCVATISVREGQTEQQMQVRGTVGSIVAVRDGVISSITVERGSGSCTIGQAVKTGQVLISGYTDCGLTIRATRAAGEVYARTQRNLTVISPTLRAQRGESRGVVKKISLIFGKNRINFYKGSGISPSTCVKMYEESYLTLPGGFRLPVGIVTETWQECATADAVVTETAEIGLTDFANSYITQQMIAGEILSSRIEVGSDDGAIYLRGEFACLEMIGKLRNEESLNAYGN